MWALDNYARHCGIPSICCASVIPELLKRALLISKEQLEQCPSLQADEQASRKQTEDSDQNACGDGPTIS